MASYIYSKWKQAQTGFPVEFYSELDAQRYETRKVEIFSDGRRAFAAHDQSTHGTRLGIIPVPPIAELKLNHEFDTKEIRQEVFEQQWQAAIKQK